MSFKYKTIKQSCAFALIIGLVSSLFSPLTANAHPHILINPQITFNLHHIEGQPVQLISLDYVWLFDENFSALLFGDYDEDQNESLSPQELTNLGYETMDGAYALEYFTHVWQDQTRIMPDKALQVRASYQDNRLTLEFNLKLPTPLPISSQFKYVLFDDEYYTAFIIQNANDYRISGQNIENCTLQIITPKKIDDNLDNALQNAFSEDITNQGLGAQFADKIAIECL